MPNRPRQHGFTIIELIVTMAILGLLLFLVNQIFQQTSRAVTTSVQASKTIAQSRSVNEQLSNDEDAMRGPGVSANGGFIVIVQHQLNNIAMLDPQTLNEVTVPTGMRSDQLVFIRDAEGLKSMTPAGAGDYRTDLIGQAGDRAKVWYGHALRTPPDGTSPGYNLGDDDAGLDSVGSNFIFARQALLFDPFSTSFNLPLSDPATTGYTYANQGYATSVVEESDYGEATDRTFHGITDVTIQDYSTLVNQLTNGVGNAPGSTSDELDYLATSYRVNANRLRVNPAPDADATNYESWAIAQSHPIMAQSCSEIIIDFAADLNGDGQIDTQFGGQSATAEAPIWWYDGLTQPNLTDGTAGGTTGWTNQASIPQPWFDNSADKKIFVFRVDDDTSFDDAGGTLGVAGTAHSYWPYLIRIRYRLHDTRGRLTSNYAPALNDNVDNDGDGDTNEFEEDKISGRWFERIIKVQRP